MKGIGSKRLRSLFWKDWNNLISRKYYMLNAQDRGSMKLLSMQNTCNPDANQISLKQRRCWPLHVQVTILSSFLRMAPGPFILLPLRSLWLPLSRASRWVCHAAFLGFCCNISGRDASKHAPTAHQTWPVSGRGAGDGLGHNKSPELRFDAGVTRFDQKSLKDWVFGTWP